MTQITITLDKKLNQYIEIQKGIMACNNKAETVTQILEIEMKKNKTIHNKLSRKWR